MRTQGPEPPFLGDLRRRRGLFEARATFLAQIREFFRTRGFLEVDPPALVPAGCMEPHLDAFEAVGTATGRRARLPTSPEFYLKQLLASGVERAFALAPAFRDEEPSGRHSPEFLMLEWYRAGEPLRKLALDCGDLLADLGGTFAPGGLGDGGGKRCDLASGVEVLDLGEAFGRWAGGSWWDLGTEDAWRARAREFGAEADGSWSPNDCFSYLLLERIEPALARAGRPVALLGFPPFQGALARECPGRPGVAERFELYVAGEEIANAYAELTDGEEQRRRYAAYQEERAARGREPHPRDEMFLRAVDHLPECSGIALGADRLLALLLGAPLSEVRHGVRAP